MTCPDCILGERTGQQASCRACQAVRHRAAARRWYQRNRVAELAKDRERVRTEAVRVREKASKAALALRSSKEESA